jgi:hypothetical protein
MGSRFFARIRGDVLAIVAAEGAAFDAHGHITDFVARRVEVAALPHGVSQQTRPAEAPRAAGRR